MLHAGVHGVAPCRLHADAEVAAIVVVAQAAALLDRHLRLRIVGVHLRFHVIRGSDADGPRLIREPILTGAPVIKGWSPRARRSPTAPEGSCLPAKRRLGGKGIGRHLGANLRCNPRRLGAVGYRCGGRRQGARDARSGECLPL